MSTTAATLAGLEAQIAVPTDVTKFIRAARADLAGTDYPGALQLGQSLAAILKQEGATPREIRLFAARYTVALEDYEPEADEAIHQIVATLADVDLKQYW